MKRQDGDDRYRVRAVTRALDVLLAFEELPPPVDLTVLAGHVGLPVTSAYRYLESLRSRGLVRQARDGGYELGPAVFELSAALVRSLSVWTQASDLAQRLAREANETASVGVLDHGEVLYIAIAQGQRELGIQSVPGTRHPAHCTALGKAMLADRPWEEVLAILGDHPPVPLTARTLVDPGELRADLERTAARGYALDDEERTLGVLCVGAPLRDQSGRVVAALSVSGPIFRLFGAERERVTSLVVATANDASSRLGFAGAAPSASPATLGTFAGQSAVRA